MNNKRYEKLQLEELPRDAVINSSMYDNVSEVDKLINEAVSDHLSKIMDEEEPSEEHSSESSIEYDKNIDKSLQNNKIHNYESEEKIDIQALKDESYNKGYEEAKAYYESQRENDNTDKKFLELLIQKLESIIPQGEIDNQISRVSAAAISNIAKKLHLILPVNFEEIIIDGLLERLKAFYKDGNVTLTVHPDRYDFCIDILQSDKIPSKFKDNFQIIKDDKLSKDDCRLEYKETRLEYNQLQLTAEIEKIIEQLKSTTDR